MKLYTVATHPDGYFNLYQKKAKKEGMEMNVLGFGEKWKGYAWKFNKFYDELSKVNPKDIVIFTDAYDVLLVNNPKEIEKRFKEMDCNILLSIEEEPSNIFHLYFYKKMFPTFGKHFINSGMYMGYAGKIREMLGMIKDQFGLKDKDDDQKVLAQFLNRNKDYVNQNCKFDEKRKIFLNVWDKPIKEIDTCFVHGPGNADLGEYISRYSLEGQIQRKEEGENRDFWAYNWKALKSYTKYFMFEAIFILLFLILIIWLIAKWIKKRSNRNNKLKLKF
jgi:hypothetical protein